MNQAGPVAQLEHVSYYYEPGTPVLEDVSLEVEPLDFLGLIGPNGGGKTTLLKLLLGLLKPREGVVRMLGRAPEETRSRVGYVPQVAGIDPTLAANVLDVVLMGRLAKTSWGPRFRASDILAAKEALAQTNTTELARKRLDELSGGQRQRVLIARALASEAEILLLDEPTAGVDFHRERELLELLHRLNKRIPIVLVTHDVALVSTHLKRAAWVHRTVNCYPARQVSLDVVERLYHGDYDHNHRGNHDCDGTDSEREPEPEPEIDGMNTR